MNQRAQWTRIPLLRLAGACASVLATCVALTACVEDLLTAKVPSRILADSLASPENAPLLVAGVIGDFECAFGAYINTTGLVTDELDDAQLQGAESFNYDRRTVSPAGREYSLRPCDFYGAIYGPVSVARYSADHALSELDGFSDTDVPDRKSLIATAAAYAGYSYLLLGEGFCSAAVDLGPELTPAQVFTLAEAKFTRAITEGGSGVNDEAVNMALVGRARARLNKGDNAGALADAQAVPAGFVKNATFSAASGRSENRIYRMNVLDRRVSINAVYRGLTFNGVPDPRVPVANTGEVGGDAVTIVWTTSKYISLDANIPIAKWQEAKLIIAEISGGQTAVDAINELHTAAGLPAFSSTDPVVIADQVKEERRREFFLESQHLYDMIRFNLPFLPVAGTDYGFKGGVYGSTTCLPLPDVERDNNPTLRGH